MKNSTYNQKRQAKKLQANQDATKQLYVTIGSIGVIIAAIALNVAFNGIQSSTFTFIFQSYVRQKRNGKRIYSLRSNRGKFYKAKYIARRQTNDKKRNKKINQNNKIIIS